MDVGIIESVLARRISKKLLNCTVQHRIYKLIFVSVKAWPFWGKSPLENKKKRKRMRNSPHA